MRNGELLGHESARLGASIIGALCHGISPPLSVCSLWLVFHPEVKEPGVFGVYPDAVSHD